MNYWLITEENFTTKLMLEWLDNNDILMYYRHNEGKSVIAESFIKKLMAKKF